MRIVTRREPDLREGNGDGDDDGNGYRTRTRTWTRMKMGKGTQGKDVSGDKNGDENRARDGKEIEEGRKRARESVTSS